MKRLIYIKHNLVQAFFESRSYRNLHKGSSKQNLGNYRPISILSPFNKIFELLLHKRLLNFWNKHDLFSKYQFGFRKHFSAGLAITQVFESLLNNKGINES